MEYLFDTGIANFIISQNDNLFYIRSRKVHTRNFFLSHKILTGKNFCYEIHFIVFGIL